MWRPPPRQSSASSVSMLSRLARGKQMSLMGARMRSSAKDLLGGSEARPSEGMGAGRPSEGMGAGRPSEGMVVPARHFEVVRADGVDGGGGRGGGGAQLVGSAPITSPVVESAAQADVVELTRQLRLALAENEALRSRVQSAEAALRQTTEEVV